VDLGALRELVRDVNFETHGVDAVVTVPDGDPVETRVIWMTPENDGAPDPGGGRRGNDQFRRTDPRRSLSIRRDDVPAVPRDTTIAVTEHLLDEPDVWRVDAIEEVRSDHVRVIVMPYEAES
jgi:hypothetical protein